MNIGPGIQDLPWREREYLEAAVVATGDDLDQPLLRALYEYWDDKRAVRPLPARADIDPTEIPRLLPHLILIDVQHEPLDLRYRLVGTHIVRANGGELTGCRVRDLQVTGVGQLFDAYAEVVSDATPRLLRGAHRAVTGALRRFDRLVLPLAAEERQPNMLLCGSIFHMPGAPAGSVAHGSVRESYRPQF
jgi:hypothetical protein